MYIPFVTPRLIDFTGAKFGTKFRCDFMPSSTSQHPLVLSRGMAEWNSAKLEKRFR